MPSTRIVGTWLTIIVFRSYQYCFILFIYELGGKMFERENTINLVICAQHIISNSESLEEVTIFLTKLRPFMNVDGLNSLFLLKMLIVSLPALLCKEEIVGCIELILELGDTAPIIDNAEKKNVDMANMFGNKSKLPAVISGMLGLSQKRKTKFVEKLDQSLNMEAQKYDFIQDSDVRVINDAQLFKKCIKSFFFRINYDFKSFHYTDSLINAVKSSRYADLQLLDWIKGFYIPLSRLSVLVDHSYTLLDYDIIISVEEKVDLVLTLIEEQNKESALINEVLIPHFQYIGIDAWNCMNSWLLNFGLKCVSENEHSKLITNYKLLLNLLRHDKFLLTVNSIDTLVKSTFVCTILATIYLCPKAVLQVFVYSKEMLTLLKSLTLEMEPDSFNVGKISGLALPEVAKAFSATYKTIDSILNVINVGEILYSNELSFVEIAALENSDKSTQFTELIKFIDNEVTFKTSQKKWSLFFSSISSTMKKTSVFNKISIEELSEAILLKLVALRQFSVINNVYRTSFNYLSKDQYEKIMVKHCWQFYMKAKNCDQKIGSLKDCVDCLELLEPNSEDARRLSSLIEANGKLLDWKFYLQPGVPVTPRDIVEVGDPLVIIKRILELNEKAYMYSGDLYYLLTLLINGMGIINENKLYQNKNKSYDDPSNLLMVKLKMLCLEFSSTVDYSYSFDSSFELLNMSIKKKYEIEGLYELISENWFLFFQLTKNDYDNVAESLAIDSKLKLLGNLLLVVPTEFNNVVLEQWQMLNSQKGQMINNSGEARDEERPRSSPIESSLGDVQARLQRSLKSSAQELLSTDSSEIGRNIIGWIVGAN